MQTACSVILAKLEPHCSRIFFYCQRVDENVENHSESFPSSQSDKVKRQCQGSHRYPDRRRELTASVLLQTVCNCRSREIGITPSAILGIFLPQTNTENENRVRGWRCASRNVRLNARTRKLRARNWEISLQRNVIAADAAGRNVDLALVDWKVLHQNTRTDIALGTGRSI